VVAKRVTRDDFDDILMPLHGPRQDAQAADLALTMGLSGVAVDLLNDNRNVRS
jgi:hypothetical protein